MKKVFILFLFFAFVLSASSVRAEDCTQENCLLLWNEKSANNFIAQGWNTNTTLDDLASQVVITTNNDNTFADMSALSETYSSVMNAAQKALQKKKLFIVPTGNSMALSPSEMSVIPVVNAEARPSFLSVVAIQSDDVSTFAPNTVLDPTTNLVFSMYTSYESGGVEKQYKVATPYMWTLAAPGTNEIGTVSGVDCTTSAVQAVASAASAVQSAFTWMKPWQVAGTLLSTATKYADIKKELGASTPTMLYREFNGQYQFFFLTEDTPWTYDTMNEAVNDAVAGKSCSSDDVSCTTTTFNHLFGEGILNEEAALNGPKGFDSDLIPAQYDSSYPAHIGQGITSIWSNNISETRYVVGLTKSGEGTLVLTGKNTFTGPTVVEQGTLSVTGTDAADNMAGLVSSLTVAKGATATVQFAALSDVVNRGTMTLTETVTANALTNYRNMTINGVVNAGTAEGDGTVLPTTVSNNGAMTVGENSVLTAVLTNEGSGAVTVSSGAALDGSFINNGHFQMNGASVLNATGTLTNNATMTLASADAVYGSLANAGSLINAGTFFLASNASVAGAGTMTNTGMVSGTLDGTASIQNTLDNQAGGVISGPMYLADFNNNGGTVLIQTVSNNAPLALTGGTIDLNAGLLDFNLVSNVPFNQPLGGNYTVIHADTMLTRAEEFAITTFGSPYMTMTPSMTGTDLVVNVAFKKLAENSPTFTASEQRLAQAYDNLFFTQGNVDVAGLYYFSESTLKNKINEILEQAVPVTARDLPLSDAMGTDIYAHLAKVRSPYPRGDNMRGRAAGNAPTRQKVWGQAIGVWSQRNGEKQASAEKVKTQAYGAMFGWDVDVTDQFLIGATAGYAQTKIKQNGNTTDVDDYRGGVYFDALMSRVSVQGIVLGGFQQYDTKKQFVFPGYTGTTEASFGGYSAEGSLNIGYLFFSNKEQGLTRQYYGSSARKSYGAPYFTMRPYIGADASYITQEAYEEKGSSLFALSVSESKETSVSGRAGVTFAFYQPKRDYYIDVSYRRLLTGASPSTTMFLMNDISKMPLDSLEVEADKDFINVGFGYVAEFLTDWYFNVWVNGQASQNTLTGALSAAVMYAF